MKPSTADLRAFAENLAREAGEIILQYFDAANQNVEIKDNATPVTAADKRINQLVIDKIAATYPEHGVLGEEGSSHADRRELWVCDPLDGTKGFIQRVPTAMFSLAYVVDGQPEVAVTYDPFQDKLFSAVRGEGARVNGRPLAVTTQSDLGSASVAISTSYRELKERRAFFDTLLDKGVNQVIVPGGVFKDSLVATGNVDGAIFPGRGAHDVAAIKLIVEEAGGKVTDLRGQEQRYDQPLFGAIVSNGRIHDELVRLIAEFGPEKYIGY